MQPLFWLHFFCIEATTITVAVTIVKDVGSHFMGESSHSEDYNLKSAPSVLNNSHQKKHIYKQLVSNT